MSLGMVLKLLHVYFLATIKYFLTFPYAMVIGLDVVQATIVVTVGGITGFLFFYYSGSLAVRLFRKFRPVFSGLTKRYLQVDFPRLKELSIFSGRPFFSKRARTIVRFRRRYGFWGIIIATPVVLSIPIGAFLLQKYYARQKNTFAYMMASILGWALVFVTITVLFPKPL